MKNVKKYYRYTYEPIKVLIQANIIHTTLKLKLTWCFMYPSFKKHEVIRTKALCSCIVTPTPPHLPSKWEAGLCSSPSSILADLFNSSLFLYLIRMITYKDTLTEQWQHYSNLHLKYKCPTRQTIFFASVKSKITEKRPI